jgi:hypothetical protein
MSLSRAQKEIIAFVKNNPGTTIAEATDKSNAIHNSHGYKEVKIMIDDGTLQLNGEVGYHTLTVPSDTDQ